MPKIFEWRGYRFFFYSEEGTPLEPPHIHVRKDGSEAKFWLRPFVSVAYNQGFSGIVLRRMAQQVVENRERIEAHCNGYLPEMTEFPEPRHIRFDEGSMWVSLSDGRVVGVPLAWYPRLLNASSNQLEQVELSPSGMHWDEIDEDISVRGILMGQMAFRPQPAAAVL